MIKHKIILKKKIPVKIHEAITTQTTQTTTLAKSYDPEELFAETLNLLFDGMAHGNQIDKKAAEALIKSIKYKVNGEFYNECLSTFEEALKIHESVFSESIINKITKDITEIIDQGREVLKKITQQIILNPPKNQS
jgi:serine/threonine protein phosphatase PrpC